MKTLNTVSLFSGIEGFSLGLALAGIPTNTILYVEQDKNAIDIIRARIKDGYIQDAPIFTDVRDLSGLCLSSCVDLVHCGSPCPPFSTNNNGARQGPTDPRNLFPEVWRLVREMELPRYILLENVAAINSASRSRPEPYSKTIIDTLFEMGYGRINWGTLTASASGANHKRDRFFLLGEHVAHPDQG